MKIALMVLLGTVNFMKKVRGGKKRLTCSGMSADAGEYDIQHCKICKYFWKCNNE